MSLTLKGLSLDRFISCFIVMSSSRNVGFFCDVFFSPTCSISQPSIMFSYKAQTDDPMEDDNVSLPHQLSCSSLKTDSDYIYQVHIAHI